LTLPEMDDTPWMLKPRLRLLGVKATLKSVAEKLELLWHGLSDLDSMMRSAEARGRAAAAARARHFDSDGSMVGVVLVRVLRFWIRKRA
jgi:hypothetical protein